MELQGVDILTFGQYLQPTPLHLPVKEHVTPQQFEHWRQFGEDVVGFRYKFLQYMHIWLMPSICRTRASIHMPRWI